jgi:hypothetical protein
VNAWAPLLLALALTGCTASRLGAPQATFTGLQAVRAAQIPTVALGRFTPGPHLPRGQDSAIIIRAAALRPPSGSTFSAYLGETLAAALTSAGRLDPASPLVISAQLDENSVDAGFGHGGGRLGATFIVTRAGREVWRKTLRVERRWSSSVIGGVAYMEAEQGYGGLYQALIEQLLADPDFRRALNAAA